MSLNTSKIFNNEDDYITLFELSKTQKYSLEYLLNAASRGKLKSFKMGDDWVTTTDWFNDYKKSVKQAIQLEISDKEINHKKDWVDFLPENNFRLRFIPQMLIILIVFSVFSFSLSWLAFSPAGNRAALSADNLVAKRYAIDNYFLHYTNQAYSYGYKYFSYVVGSSWYSVELLTNSLVVAGHETAYIALTIDQNVSKYKISDEIITQKINKLADALKDKYQAVAGESTIRKQIYFDDWQKSSKTGN